MPRTVRISLRSKASSTLARKAPHGHFDHIGVAVEVHVPDLGRNQRTRQHFTLPAQQQFEQCELLGREVMR